MRRFLLALVSTVAGLVALLSFKTHEVSSAKAPAAISATLDPTTEPTAAAGSSSTASGSNTASGSGTTSGSNTTSGSSSGTSSSTPAASPSSSSASATKTATGTSVDTRWGPVQVRITVTGGKLASVSAIVYPTENPRDQEINSYAVPELNKEALAAGSAKIDMISGATYTSTGYINSLQSALDKAGL